MRSLALITMTVTALAAPSLRAQAPVEADGLETRVWLDRGDEPVLRRGETVRIYYRTSEDAYAAIFRIDTDGRIALVFPQDPSADAFVRGGRDYRLMLPASPVWRVDEDPGAGYFFMVASPEPLDLSALPFDPAVGWDLSAIGDVVYEDPYVAIDEYVAQVIPSWEVVPYALDFIAYNVGDTHTYPRFLCYECHEARSYDSWNPYSVPCTTYRVVIWDDPYFYPYYRYSGTRVVVARPLVTQPRYAVATRVAGDSYRPLVRTRPAPPRTVADFKESPAAGTPTATPRRVTPETSQSTPRPTLQRRPTPSSRLPVRTPPPSDRTTAPATPSRGDTRIVRPTRPSAPSATPSRTTPTTRSGAGSGGRPAASPRSSPPTSSRPSGQPSSPTRPRVQPSAPSRPTAQPSTRSRPSAQPSAPSRPTARPAAPSRPATTSPSARPTVQPRPNNSGRRPGG
jgi:hypothetical protein